VRACLYPRLQCPPVKTANHCRIPQPEHPQRSSIETCPPRPCLVMDNPQRRACRQRRDIYDHSVMMRGAARSMSRTRACAMPRYLAHLRCPPIHAGPQPTNLTLHEGPIEMPNCAPGACGDAPAFPVIRGATMICVIINPRRYWREEVGDEAVEMDRLMRFRFERGQRRRRGSSGFTPQPKQESLDKFAEWASQQPLS